MPRARRGPYEALKLRVCFVSKQLKMNSKRKKSPIFSGSPFLLKQKEKPKTQ
jgi:hypothetical protein